MSVSFFIKLLALTCNFIKKETQVTQVFFCEFCEISKNIFLKQYWLGKVGSCLHAVYLSSVTYKSFGSFGMSAIVKSQEQVYYLLLLVIFSNDKTLYNPLSKYRNLVKVLFKQFRNYISHKYLIQVSCKNAFFQS